MDTNTEFKVGDHVNVLRACRLPAIEEVVSAGVITSVNATPGRETLYYVSGHACGRTARVLRLRK